MLIEHKSRYSIIYKAITIVLVCLFAVNDIAWAQDLSSVIARRPKADEAISKKTLATPTQLTDAQFREKFIAKEFLLSEDGVDHYLQEQIKKEKGILVKDWQSRRAELIDINNPAVRGLIKDNVKGLESVMLVRVAGLLASTSQFAHVGLSGRDYGGIPVIYIDSTLTNTPDKCIQKHGIDEILQWENLRVNILHIATRPEMRQWITKNIKEARQYAKIFNESAYPLRTLHKSIRIATGINDAEVNTYFDYRYIKNMLSLYGTDEDSRNVNIAAAGQDKEKPAVSLIDKYPMLRDYHPTNLKDTLHWLNEHRSQLGNNSLGYLIQALATAGRLPEGESEEAWARSAGAYDFYLNSPLLQSYEPKNIEDTLHWLDEHRSQLGNNSLSYLIHALAIAGRLPEGESEKNWEFSAAAYDFYLNSPLLQSYEPKNIEDTLHWLDEHRSQLGNNSLGYLIQALAIAGRLPVGKSEETWERSAAAYDFYLNSPLLQNYKPNNLEDTLHWLDEHRSQLGNNSLGYLIQALATAGRLPKGTNKIRWQFLAGAFDRAIHEEQVISSEIDRIWRNGLGKDESRTDLTRLRAMFDPVLLANLITGKPLSDGYRNMILGFAYDIYGRKLIEDIKRKGPENVTPSSTFGGASGGIDDITKRARIEELLKKNPALVKSAAELLKYLDKNHPGILEVIPQSERLAYLEGLLKKYSSNVNIAAVAQGAQGPALPKVDAAVLQKGLTPDEAKLVKAVVTNNQQFLMIIGPVPETFVTIEECQRLIALGPKARKQIELIANNNPQFEGAKNSLLGKLYPTAVVQSAPKSVQTPPAAKIDGPIPKKPTAAPVQEAPKPAERPAPFTLIEKDKWPKLFGPEISKAGLFVLVETASCSIQTDEYILKNPSIIFRVDPDRKNIHIKFGEKMYVLNTNMEKIFGIGVACDEKLTHIWLLVITAKKGLLKTKYEVAQIYRAKIGETRKPEIPPVIGIKKPLQPRPGPESGIRHPVKLGKEPRWVAPVDDWQLNAERVKAANEAKAPAESTGQADAHPGYHWETEKRGIENVRYVLSREVPHIIQRYDNIDKLSDAEVENLMNNVYRITQAHFKLWGLSRALHKERTPYFNGSHIDILLVVFPKLRLNPLGFRLDYLTREKAIESVRYVLSREVPHIIQRYDNLDKLTPGEIESLRNDVYKITHAHLELWQLSSAFDRRVAPYFNGSYIDALLAVFPKLALSPLGFQLEWSTKEKAIESVRYVLSREVPHIIQRYDNLDKLTPGEIEGLRNDVYKITHAYFKLWGLSRALSKKRAPYFNGSYIDALLVTFPKLNLNRSEFPLQLEWSTREKAIESVRYVLSREVPHIIQRYDRLDNLTEEQIETLRNDMCRITSAHFKLWGLSRALSKKRAPYFNGSYIDALLAIFDNPRLGLTDSYIRDFRKRHMVFRYRWDSGIRVGIFNVMDGIGQNRPDIIQRYESLDSLIDEEVSALSKDIYRITSAHFVLWGLSSALSKKRAPYFNGSYIDALLVTFPKLNLNRSEFPLQLDWSTREKAIESVRYVLSREVPHIIQRYDNLDKLTPGEIEALKNDIYRITHAHLGVWGLSTALRHRSAPYFSGAYFDPLLAVFPRLNLNLLGFLLNWSTKEKAIESVRYVLSREVPHIIQRYDNLDKLTLGEIEGLRNDVYRITKAHFDLWGLSSTPMTSHFRGSYIYALIITLPKLRLNPLGFRLDWSTKEKAIESVRYVLSREVPHIIQRYDNLDKLTPGEIEALKNDVCRITGGCFEIWGLGGALNRRVAPYFNGSYIDALLAVFPKLALSPLGFQLEWSTKEKAIESVRYVLSREVPHIIQRYDNLDKLTPGEIESLRNDICRITNGHFHAWKLEGALKSDCFNRNYSEALLAVFNDERLGLMKPASQENRQMHIAAVAASETAAASEKPLNVAIEQKEIEGKFYLTARFGDAILGSVEYYLYSLSTIWFRALKVAGKYKRRRVGQYLFEQILAEARNKRATNIACRCLKSNKAALEFYNEMVRRLNLQISIVDNNIDIYYTIVFTIPPAAGPASAKELLPLASAGKQPADRVSPNRMAPGPPKAPALAGDIRLRQQPENSEGASANSPPKHPVEGSVNAKADSSPIGTEPGPKLTSVQSKFPKSAEEIIRQTEDLLVGAHLFDSPLDIARIIDELGIGEKDNILHVGCGSFSGYPVVRAIKGAKVDVVDPGVRDMKFLSQAIDLDRQEIARVTGKDLIGDRINTTSHQTYVQSANIQPRYYSYAFLLNVLEIIFDKEEKRQIIEATLSSLKDDSTILVSAYAASVSKQIDILTEHAENLGYTVERGRVFSAGERVYELKIHRIKGHDLQSATVQLPAVVSPTTTEIASSFDKSSGRSPERSRGASSPSAPRNDGEELTAQNIPDIENLVRMAYELSRRENKKDSTLFPKEGEEKSVKYYTVRYNSKKISKDAEKLLKLYVENKLSLFLHGEHRIKLEGSGNQDQGLIWVECYTQDHKIGEAHVDIKEYHDGEAFRIIGMLNMAFLASQIPSKIPPEDADKYELVKDIIKRQFVDLGGDMKAIEDALKDTVKGIWINLPHAAQVPINKTAEYYELTMKQLEQAA